MKKVLRIVGVTLAIIIIAAVGLFLWMFTPGSTEKLEEVANRFQPDASWELVNETVRPPVNACFNAQCDYLRRTWNTNHITKEEFSQSIRKSGFNMDIVGDCDPDQGLKGAGSTICSSSGIVDEQAVEVYVNAASDSPDDISIILRVEG